MIIVGILLSVFLIFLFVMAKFVGTNVNRDTSMSSLGACNEFEDEASRNSCLRSLANKNLDVTPCLQIRKIPERDACLRNVAIKSKDKQLCGQITTIQIREMCAEQIS